MESSLVTSSFVWTRILHEFFRLGAESMRKELRAVPRQSHRILLCFGRWSASRLDRLHNVVIARLDRAIQ
jgi:hypothetical protein